MINDVYKMLEEKMQSTVSKLRQDLGTVRTGRASLSLLDGINVDYYGTLTPLNQVASLSVPESRLIMIQPWDNTIINAIEKAIIKSNLGLTPSNDGKLIRIAIPSLTEERRKELVKIIKRMAEDSRISLRNVRREANDLLKKLEKDKEITEDKLHKSEEEVQKVTDKYIGKINEVLENKEKEVLEF